MGPLSVSVPGQRCARLQGLGAARSKMTEATDENGPPVGTYDPPDLWREAKIRDAGKYAIRDERSGFARLLDATEKTNLFVGTDREADRALAEFEAEAHVEAHNK